MGITIYSMIDSEVYFLMINHTWFCKTSKKCMTGVNINPSVEVTTLFYYFDRTSNYLLNIYVSTHRKMLLPPFICEAPLFCE